MANEKKETEVEVVTMNDGNKVEFAGKRKMLKSVVKDHASGHPAIRIDFRNGETRTFAAHPAIVRDFAAHGMLQKYGDETAGLTDIDDMVQAVDELHDRLHPVEGDPRWTEAREPGVAGTSVLARALLEFHGGKKSLEEIKTWLKGKTPAEKTAMRANAKLVPIIQRLETEKNAGAAAKVDTEALLAELQ